MSHAFNYGHAGCFKNHNQPRCFICVPATEVVTFIDYYPHEEMTYWQSSPLVLKSQSITNAGPTPTNVHLRVCLCVCMFLLNVFFKQTAHAGTCVLTMSMSHTQCRYVLGPLTQQCWPVNQNTFCMGESDVFVQCHQTSSISQHNWFIQLITFKKKFFLNLTFKNDKKAHALIFSQ